MAKPPKLKEPVCPRCGGVYFECMYTEMAWERWHGDQARKAIQFGEDGHDVDSHESHLERARCRSCNKVVDLSGLVQS